jgi:hypothetical protein
MQSDDVRQIEALIARQFASLNWTDGAGGQWDVFSGDFLEGASLYPSARPARRQDVGSFIARMKGLAQSTLPALQEQVLGSKVEVFGNIAVAVAACEMTENDVEVRRTVEMMLLVKEEGGWKIAAQAWDLETPEMTLPTEFVG